MVSTFLSAACTWWFSESYDESENTRPSEVAAILSCIALCGCTFGFCGCPLGNGGGETQMGMGFLWQCLNSCDGDDVFSLCFRLLAGCGLFLLIGLSFGLLQVGNPEHNLAYNYSL